MIELVEYQGRDSEAGTDEEIVYLISAASPARWLGPGARYRRGCATAEGIHRGLLRHVRGPPGSMTQASSRSQWLRNWGNSWPMMAVGECG